MVPETARVLCIGFQKTGTTSISEALVRLGFTSRNIHREVNAYLTDHPEADPQQVSEEIGIDTLKSVDVIEDSPTPFIFEALDRAYPGSKFILTTRETDKWIKSYTKFFPNENNPLRRWMYGVDQFSGHEERYRSIYERQNTAIRSYFADRPGDFLEMDLAKGVGWHDLVTFLGPDHLPPFPHANVGTAKGVREPRSRRTGLRGLLRRLAG